MDLPNLKHARHLIERVESTRLVFRVFDSSSDQFYHPETGFLAHVDCPFDISDAAVVEQSVKERLRFNNREATPWISTTRRWLWAVWEADRRTRTKDLFNRGSIQIAVIDLGACWAANRRTPIRALGYYDLPFIHALSGLSGADEKFRRFADMSDEILIYHQVPASAVISIWRFDKDFISTLPSRVIDSLPTPQAVGEAQSFRSSRRRMVDQFINDKRSGRWDAGEAGTFCATVALVILQDAYNRLAGDVDEVVIRARTSEKKNQTLSRTLPRSVTRGSTNKKSYSFAQADAISIVCYIMNDLVALEDPFCRESIEPIVARITRYLATEVDPSLQQFYEGFLAHKQIFMDQVMSILNGSALMIRARHTHYKLIKFRALALELARTVPLGLMDDLKITRSDWLTMKQHMFRTISTKLAPLVSKLRPLMNAPWPGDTLGDEAKIQLGVEEAKEREWMRKEVYYPLWWEI